MCEIGCVEGEKIEILFLQLHHHIIKQQASKSKNQLHHVFGSVPHVRCRPARCRARYADRYGGCDEERSGGGRQQAVREVRVRRGRSDGVPRRRDVQEAQEVQEGAAAVVRYGDSELLPGAQGKQGSPLAVPERQGGGGRILQELPEGCRQERWNPLQRHCQRPHRPGLHGRER